MEEQTIEQELRELIASGREEAIRAYCAELHPATVAESISGLGSAEIWRFLMALDIHLRADIFSHFELDRQVELVRGQNRSDMAGLLEEMPPDDRADLVQRLDPKVREEILPLVAKAEREDIRKLVSYEQGSAGSVMSSDYATLRPDLSAMEAIEEIRKQAPSKETIYYIYVVDEQRRLAGFVSLKDLILAKPGKTVRDLMHHDIITALVAEDQEEVARKIEKYDLIAIPVVDTNNVLVGIITYDDALDIIRQEQAEDIEKFMAISGRHKVGEYLRTPALRHFQNRVWWVLGLAIVGLLSGVIIHRFENVLTNLLILALYMPMLADTGGNTGSQSATVVVRALALREISYRDVLRVLSKEFRISLMLAVLLGVLSFGKVMLLSRGADIPRGHSLLNIAVVIAAALGLQVITSTLFGAMLPLIAAKFKQDPAVVASPALTTCVDITGLLIYFLTAKTLLGV